MTIFSSRKGETTPRADMFLPDFVKYFSLFLDAAAVAFLVATFVTQIWGLMIGVLLCGGFGVAMLLCWKNQRIRILDDEKFEYTTFLGNTRVYRFSDIRELRVNNDSLTLFLTNGKVHIEAMVYMSETLYNKINAEVAKR